MDKPQTEKPLIQQWSEEAAEADRIQRELRRDISVLTGQGERISLPSPDLLDSPLKAVSQVIELKPGRKYAFFFKRLLTRQERDVLEHRLNTFGIAALVCGIDADMQVIEVPDEAEQKL